MNEKLIFLPVHVNSFFVQLNDSNLQKQICIIYTSPKKKKQVCQQKRSELTTKLILAYLMPSLTLPGILVLYNISSKRGKKKHAIPNF